jgi:ATP-dependent Lon protease
MKLKQLVKKENRLELPLVPIKELVVFPWMTVPFFVGREGSIQAVEQAMSAGRTLFLACQKGNSDKPSEEDIYPFGTVCRILQVLKLPDGTFRVLAEGKERGSIRRFKRTGELFSVSVAPIEETKELTGTHTALMDAVRQSFERLKKYHKKLPKEAITAIERAEYPDKLVDLICAHVPLKFERKVELLAIADSAQRLEQLAVAIEQELELLTLQQRIQTKVRKRIEKSQKEYFLNEQLKEIKKELGTDSDEEDELTGLEKRILERNPPEEIVERSRRELRRLTKLQPMSPESGVIRTYLEWIADLPWSERSNDSFDIDAAARVLDEDHYDMKKPKERILDFIAVRQLTDVVRGPILCLVGPPGTGKTSLGRSVARALGREFVRMSLGGVRDEAEIRGHRKTYVGALPGKIIQSMRKVGTINPVFLLDEVDKMSSDYRGDPASALLEVLDPEQNNSFMDHYLELPYDLSAVFFITTANSMYTIPYALRDRMEIIEIPGYTEFEKVRIAGDFLIPKQIRENGLEGTNISFNEPAIRTIIQSYTMESGVRNLEREIAAVIRKVARDALKKGYRPPHRVAAAEHAIDAGGEPTEAPPVAYRTKVTPAKVESFLGKKRFLDDLVYRDGRAGLVHGLAWTETGGTLLPVEVAVIEGAGELILTGSLGEVMKESARTALSFIRAHSKRFNLPGDFYRDRDVHIHVPEGAIPKDGPSAGITITAALVSAFTGVPVESRIAMTGEITLTGRLLAIGGLKEKVLAAHRNKMRAVLLPEQNRKDIAELPREVKAEISFIHADSALDALLALFPGSFDR